MMDKDNSQGITSASLDAHMNANAKQAKQSACVKQSHEQVINNLLTQVQKIDFRQRAEIDPNDTETKLKKAHYLIIAVEEVLELAKKNQWGLCERDGFFYTFNGAFWKPVPQKELRNFLKKAAEKMGVEKFTARYTEFVDSLFKQFSESAYLPAPMPNPDTVRINLTNGTFEIRTDCQELRTPDAADFLTHQLPFAYDPKATAPLFQKFLDEVQPDADCQKLLAEYIGYVFVPSAKLKLEKTLLLYGSGANGKSVFFEIITALLGPENVSHNSLQSLTDEKGYNRPDLATKLVNYASEISGKLETNIFKQLVSGEPIEARLPYGQPFILKNYAKLIFNCNELPTDVEHTPAYFRRFLIVPFGVTIPEHQQDKQLAAKIIQAELSGVFNWVLAGLHRLLEQGRFTDCQAVAQQIDAYKRQSDSVRLFLDEQGYKADLERYTPLKDLYRDYKGYCCEDGYRAVNNRNFQKRLNANGVQTERKSFGHVAFVRKVETPY
jgi:putative DNA primase/helicase